MKVFLLLLLLLLARLFGHPAAAQNHAAAAVDSVTATVAAQTTYLADALRLSAHQRQRVAVLLRRQLRWPARPVPPAAWLRVLTLNQYQAWQHASTFSPGLCRVRLPAPAPPTAALLAGGTY
ncbi:hypothetical protein [Hymenobacter ruricola]|uniref:Uncharacterized protein n=1 Tax=Hymenobacter ruricola TaxID=2791023 RepID=A0ABS0I430_9BACT|nr:hypothetical protein [Hymenobacter ruricola]MBF9221710.1 hypothetical protein [Hymenobacter ruricola]